MYQNAIGDVTELEHVKQLTDLGVANGNIPLIYNIYLALLLDACTTVDTRCKLPGKQKRAVDTTAISGNNVDEPYAPVDGAGYTAYSVYMNITEIRLMRRIQIDSVVSLEIVVEVLVRSIILNGLR
jgi:hypothetical protein